MSLGKLGLEWFYGYSKNQALSYCGLRSPYISFSLVIVILKRELT